RGEFPRRSSILSLWRRPFQSMAAVLLKECPSLMQQAASLFNPNPLKLRPVTFTGAGNGRTPLDLRTIDQDQRAGRV
ncbi:hypothetical protein, partial [Hoeflea sp.]|uniref:hypothetical protein n=1 Tax=Hoeflea sp. TaxID=1940281 RepID=UPI0025C072B6